ncbi:hypothetical protein BGZ51_005298 [Haplosporangium sp. Z 767]|nr:hypothetical protein BGZ51_005298 [Haplosporangium sp. Z 767]KAF9187633.1 hypothetical protein BGZ50_001826 [Haplosporangium sp. Z 11]
MLNLLKATAVCPITRTRQASPQAMCSIARAINTVSLPTHNIRSAAIHRTSRWQHSAAAAATPPSPPSSSSSPPTGEATPPTKDPPTGVDNPSSKQSSSVSPPSTSFARRKLKSRRESARGIGKASISSEPSNKVYVPSIPDSFLKTHYHRASENRHRADAIPYHIHKSVLTEVMNTMASCLLPPSGPQAHIERMPARHNNILLNSPSEGSSRMLETITLAAAHTVGADVITVDMQDLMELTPDMFNSKGSDYMDNDDDDDDDDDDDNDRERTAIYVDSRTLEARTRLRHNGIQSAASLKEKLEKFWTALLLAEPAPLSTTAAQSQTPLREKTLPKVLFLNDIADIIHTSLGSALLSSLTSAVLTLRRAGHNIMVVAGHSPSLLTTQSQDDENDEVNFKGKSDAVSGDTEPGAAVPVITIIEKLRSSSERSQQSGFIHSLLSSLTFDSFPGATQNFHHISIPPFLLTQDTASTGFSGTIDRQLEQRYASENAELLKRDKSDRIRTINCRNLLAVMRFRGGMLPESESDQAVFGSLQGIATEVWGFGKVYRLISNALGSLYLDQKEKHGSIPKKPILSQAVVQNALDTMNENARLRKVIASSGGSGEKKPTKPLVRHEDCDRYERRLLGSIVDPGLIRTTFKNTITPAETIHALQTMITLPLVRPQLFSYGLLQNEFLSGLLLFGPPGTGKTLLAKAVAKESGARMLEIKASDIFDMYVGEGEKNVSAVFSLARKLAPCVIFLDEVDSIFRARGSGVGGGGGGGHSSQREILNQFMVEWDGLRSSGRNNGIVVMASTNRPFELDDAVLRRLPRRILVDLPSEQARERILNVYLGQENLGEDIDIKDLAKKTALFSGSDLKNLCVSAALASVREEIENEVKNLQGSERTFVEELSNDRDKELGTVLDLTPLLDQYKQEAQESLPAGNVSFTKTLTAPTPTPVRVIRKKHFEKAFAHITPSCSDSMESLIELRKWDGLYGDGGKQRRKTNKGLGFGVDHPSSKARI